MNAKSLDKLIEEIDITDLLKKKGITFVDAQTKKRTTFTAIAYGDSYIISCSNGEESITKKKKAKDYLIYIMTDHGLSEPNQCNNLILW